MTKALLIHDLKKTYSSGKVALQGIDLEVKAGDFFGLLGRNGAGKSTTIGILTSLLTLSSGSVSIFGFDLEKNAVMAKSCIGLVPQEFNFNIFEKVIDILVSQAGYYGIPRTRAFERSEYYLKKMGLWEQRDMPARMLSGGMKRRLMIARALVHDPKMLILDEPTAGVDIELRRLIWQFLQELNQAGTTIILTTHYLEEAEHLCRHIAIIDNGQIIKNMTTKQLLAELHSDTLICDLAYPLSEVPVISEYLLTKIDDRTLEVIVPKGHHLNHLFKILTEKGIEVVGMRNKTNRLEQLFLNTIHSER